MADIFVFKSPGISSFILKRKASSFIPLLEEENCGDDEDQIHIKTIAKKIKNGIKEMVLDKSCYTKLSSDNLFDECSDTLTNLLSSISPNLDKNFIMVGNILTCAVKKVSIKLQISFGILAHKNKLIEQLHNFKTTSSYQKVCQFKISAAMEADKLSTQFKRKLRFDSSNFR